MQLLMPKIKILTATIFVFGIFWNFSCSWFTAQKTPPPKSTPKEEKSNKVSIRDKEALQFAFVGESGRLTKIDTLNQQTPTPVNTESMNTPRTAKMTRKDSLYQLMQQKVKRLQKKRENRSQNYFSQVQTSKEKPKLVSKPDKKVKDKNTPLSKYQEIVEHLHNNEEPFTIVIGRGKNYWIGSLASQLFTFGTKEYNQMLEWIVENNKLFKKTADLNMVRVGDKLLLPTKEIVIQQLNEGQSDSVAINNL